MTRVVVLAGCGLIGIAVAVGQTEQKPAEMPAKTAAEAFKNIQVLKTVPADQLQPTMRYIAASLGVQCGFCHVFTPGQGPNFAADDKKEKQTARDMMKMVMSINQANFDNRQEVSCNTCHNGHPHPQSIPADATEASMQQMMENTNMHAASGAGQQAGHDEHEARPSAEAIFQKYEQAIGGSDAVAKLTSIEIKGTVSTSRGNSDFEQINKAPDKFWLSMNTPRGEQVQGWDGTEGWVKMANHVEPMRDTTEMKLNADFYRSLKFAGRYKGARVVRKEKVGDRDAWVVFARDSDPQFSDMLYFDTETGLLLRRQTLRRTALGPLPTTVDFSDYREVSGVKMAFKVMVSTWDSVQNIQVSDMKANVEVPDSRFEMPKEAAGQ